MGCAAISSFGSVSSSRARISFCWFPPDSVRRVTSMLRVADVEQLHQPGGELLDLLDEQHAEPARELRVVLTARGPRSPTASCRGPGPARAGPRGCSRHRRCGSSLTGPPGDRRLPSSWIVPASGVRSPISASASSRWPLPSTPATPRISPARTSKVDAVQLPLARRAPRRGAPARRSRPAASPAGTAPGGRPSSRRAWPSRSRPGVVSPTTAPRRSTVIRSAISSTSSSLWLMNTIVLPGLPELAEVAEQILRLARA